MDENTTVAIHNVGIMITVLIVTYITTNPWCLLGFFFFASIKGKRNEWLGDK